MPVPGRVAQRESARFTRERSLVRNQPCPLVTPTSSAAVRLSPGLLALFACVAALGGCSPPGVFSSGVACDELSSRKWKTLANGERKDEAEAIEECGTLDGMTEAEVAGWMGKSIEKSFNVKNGNRIESWLIGTSPDNSDLPLISVEYGSDGKVSDTRINEG